MTSRSVIDHLPAMVKALHAGIVLAALPAASLIAAEPGPIWEETWVLQGPCCGDSGDDLVIDQDGTYFITGRYGAIDFDGDGRTDSHADGGNDPLIMKGRPEGDPERGQLLWVRSARTPDQSFGMVRVAADRSGGAYMGGGFRERLELHSGDFVECRGDSDGFIGRFDHAGEPLWVRSVGGEGSDSLTDMASDHEGNVYALASVQGEVRIEHGTSGSDVDADKRHLLFSFDRDGDLRWQRLIAGSASNSVRLDVSRRGDVLITGYYTGGDVDLDGDGTGDLPVAGDVARSYVAVFDSTGDRVLMWTAAGPEHVQLLFPAVAENGDLIILGGISGPADLDGDGSPDLQPPAGDLTLALSRFDASGDLLWARTYQDIQPLPVIMHMTAGNGRIVLTGHYKGPLDWDGDGAPEGVADEDGKSEGLIVVLDQDGHLEHLFTIVGQDHDQIRASGLSPDGQTVWATGFLRQLADFDGDGRPEGGIRCDNFGDIFGARYTLGDR